MVLAVVAAYGPVWWAGFVWDDSINVTTNPCIVGPQGLKDIWTTSAAQFYPLTLTTFWLEHALWGLQPLPYHLVNVLMHVASAVVLWHLLRQLSVPGAWLGAALWALHPVQVESVAWITELKNTESGLFYFLSILFFVGHLRSQNPARLISWDRDYALSLLFAVLAIASKSSTVILPLVLCLCAWWVEGRWQWRNLLKVAPLVPFVIAACLLTIWTQALSSEAGSTGPPEWHTWQGHLAAAGEGFWFYLGKVAWPYPLIALYPQLKIETSNPFSYLPFLAVVVAYLILWWWRRSWARPYFFAFAYFLAALLPELEFAGWYVGDHFQYLASAGPLALAGAGLVCLAQQGAPSLRWVPSTVCAALLLVLGCLAWNRARAFQNGENLWTQSLAWNPNSSLARYNLAVDLSENGQLDPAMDQLRQAIELKPDFLKALYNLGELLGRKGRLDEAAAQYRRALEFDPNYFKAHFNLGSTLLLMGKSEEAIAQFQAALKIDPNYPLAHSNLGVALAQAGRLNEAIEQYKIAIQLQPDFKQAQDNLALAQENLRKSADHR